MNEIILLNIEHQYEELVTFDETIKSLHNINVKFDYKDVRGCNLRIETDKEIDIIQIKHKILDALGL